MGKEGKKKEKRKEMVNWYIFEGGKEERRKEGKIKFGIDEKSIEMRMKKRNEMWNEWRGKERLKKFVKGKEEWMNKDRL